MSSVFLAARPDYVRRVVVNVVEVEQCRELGIGRAGEEIQAAVLPEDFVALLDDGLDRGEHEDVVVAAAAGQSEKLAFDVLQALGIDIAKVDAVPFRLLGRTGSMPPA